MENRKKIKVAYFFPVYRTVSLARWTEAAAGVNNKAEYTVSFVGLKLEESFKSEVSGDVCLVDLSNYHIPGALFKLIRYFKKERPDIFVSAFPHINAFIMLAKIISRVKMKVILTEHNHFFLLVKNARTLYRRFFGMFILPHLMRIFYPLSDAIICASNGVSESISDVIGPLNKIKTIYYSVASKKIYYQSKERVDHPWFLNQKVPIVLAVGRLVNQKDYPTLIKAFKLVVQKKPARLVILGEGADRLKIEKFIQELGISENVALLGFQKNPFKYMGKASVFVLSSAHEGFGNVIIEAMACGTPVVATNCKSGPGEIIENGKNGILVPVGNYKSLSEAIIKVLSDFSLRQKLSKEGMNRAGYFSIERNNKQYEEIFQKLMS